MKPSRGHRRHLRLSAIPESREAAPRRRSSRCSYASLGTGAGHRRGLGLMNCPRFFREPDCPHGLPAGSPRSSSFSQPLAIGLPFLVLRGLIASRRRNRHILIPRESVPHRSGGRGPAVLLDGFALPWFCRHGRTIHSLWHGVQWKTALFDGCGILQSATRDFSGSGDMQSQNSGELWGRMAYEFARALLEPSRAGNSACRYHIHS